jgi:hypothetical protein
MIYGSTSQSEKASKEANTGVVSRETKLESSVCKLLPVVTSAPRIPIL